MQHFNWLNPNIRLQRWHYLLSGLALMLIKYNLDRLIAYAAFDHSWYAWGYLDYFDLTTLKNPTDVNFAITLAATAFPFVIVGTLLTMRRLLDAGLPRWLVALFFIPFVNLVFFGLLSMIPTSTGIPRSAESHRRNWLDRIMPTNETTTGFVASFVAALFSIPVAFVGISLVADYNMSLFLGVPFIQGLAAVLLFGYRKERSVGKCLRVAAGSVAYLGLFVFAAAIEGVLCIFMAAPIVLPFAILGGLVGYHIQKRSRNGLPAAMLILAMMPMSSWIESQGHDESPLVPVTTSVIIDRPKQAVWDQLVSFNNMAEPESWLFKSGIAYPVRAVIKGRGVGAIRRCQFSTGDFIEPITEWNEPNLLRFAVDSMPPPLVELSIYNDLKLPHLENYFLSEKGQFKLVALNDHQTMLEGTTWYRHRIWPRTYWLLWSDYILHKIHLRVLNHIKETAEARD